MPETTAYQNTYYDSKTDGTASGVKSYARGDIVCCMYERNKALVDSADICLCYLRQKQSGSAFTVALAAKRGLHIIPVGGTGGIESELLCNQLDLESMEFD